LQRKKGGAKEDVEEMAKGLEEAIVNTHNREEKSRGQSEQ